MAGKKKSTVEIVKTAVLDAAAAVVEAADEHVVQPVGKAVGLIDAKKKEAKAKGTKPAKKPAAKESSAAKAMTKPLGGKKSASAKVMSQRVADAPRPEQRSAAGGGAKGPSRGAAKGK